MYNPVCWSYRLFGQEIFLQSDSIKKKSLKVSCITPFEDWGWGSCFSKLLSWRIVLFRMNLSPCHLLCYWPPKGAEASRLLPQPSELILHLSARKPQISKSHVQLQMLQNRSHLKESMWKATCCEYQMLVDLQHLHLLTLLSDRSKWFSALSLMQQRQQ